MRTLFPTVLALLSLAAPSAVAIGEDDVYQALEPGFALVDHGTRFKDDVVSRLPNCVNPESPHYLQCNVELGWVEELLDFCGSADVERCLEHLARPPRIEVDDLPLDMES